MLRALYLVLAILGAVVPMYHFVAWFRAEGWSLGGMIAAWNVNSATTGLVWDLTIAAVALTVFVIAECWARRDWLGLVAVPATYCVGVSLGVPLYLWLRSRPAVAGR
jgi:hypothetical protein